MRLRGLIESGPLQDVVMHFKTYTHISLRKKLEPELEKAFVLKISDSLSRDRVQNPPSEVQSMLGSEAPPWAESYEISPEQEGRLISFHQNFTDQA